MLSCYVKHGRVPLRPFQPKIITLPLFSGLVRDLIKNSTFRSQLAKDIYKLSPYWLTYIHISQWHFQIFQKFIFGIGTARTNVAYINFLVYSKFKDNLQRSRGSVKWMTVNIKINDDGQACSSSRLWYILVLFLGFKESYRKYWDYFRNSRELESSWIFMKNHPVISWLWICVKFTLTYFTYPRKIFCNLLYTSWRLWKIIFTLPLPALPTGGH